MKTLENLSKGETLLTTVRQVAGDKYQIAIREFVDNPESPTINIAALLNADDERFSNQAKPRAAYQAGSAEQLKKYFNIDVEKLSFDENGICEVNILNPKMEGYRLHIQVEDSYSPFFINQPQKRVNSKHGVMLFYKDGKPIYQRTTIVGGEPKHHIIRSDERRLEEAIMLEKSPAIALNN